MRRRWRQRAGSRRRGRVVRLVLVVALAVTGLVVVARLDDGAARPVRAPLSVAAERISHRERGGARLGAKAIPIGARPGRGRAAPLVLTPAEELADVGRLPPAWSASVHTVTLGGHLRSYLVVVPAEVRRDHGLAMYLALHGRRGNPAAFARLTSLASVTGPAVLVYPAGYEDSWNAGACCGYAHADGINDVAFVRRVVAQVLSQYPAVSPRRVYALGFSNGGRMTYRLACDLPGTFAGMAAVEAVPVMDCSHLHPLDVEIIAQRHDPLLTIDNGAAPKMTDGYVEPTVQMAVARWRSLDGCAPTPTRRSVGDAVLETWGCRDGTRLQYTLYRGGGHVWPQGRGAGQPSADQVVLSAFAPPGHGGLPDHGGPAG